MPKHSQAKERAMRMSLGMGAKDTAAKRRNLLTLIAVGICVAWALSSLIRPRASDRQYSPGPVSQAHAQLGCNSCHGAASPMRDATFLSGWSSDVDREVNKNDSATNQVQFWHRKADMLCQACHPVTNDGKLSAEILAQFPKPEIAHPIPISIHSEHQTVESVDSCASCHAEHLGFDHLPSQVADTSCIRCHQTLKEFRVEEGEGIESEVHSFESKHPEFRSLQTDTGTLKFNHGLHMAVGLTDPDSQLKSTKTIDSYPDHNGQLSKYVDAQNRIELQCNFCHQPFGPGGSTVEMAGANEMANAASSESMSMPTYEQSCRVCHPIDLLPAGELNFVKKLPVEHGASPEKIANDLKVYLTLEAFAPKEMANELALEQLNPPGDVPTQLWDAGTMPVEIPEKVRVYFADAATKIRANCVFCHLTADNDPGQGIPIVRGVADSRSIGKMIEVYESNWFKMARFDHAAHRDVGCTDCHVMSGGKGDLLDAGKNISLDKPMIEGVESCRQCHRSGLVKAPLRSGPTDCNSCHWYHRP